MINPSISKTVFRLLTFPNLIGVSLRFTLGFAWKRWRGLGLDLIPSLLIRASCAVPFTYCADWCVLENLCEKASGWYLSTFRSSAFVTLLVIIGWESVVNWASDVTRVEDDSCHDSAPLGMVTLNIPRYVLWNVIFRRLWQKANLEISTEETHTSVHSHHVPVPNTIIVSPCSVTVPPHVPRTVLCTVMDLLITAESHIYTR